MNELERAGFRILIKRETKKSFNRGLAIGATISVIVDFIVRYLF